MQNCAGTKMIGSLKVICDAFLCMQNFPKVFFEILNDVFSYLCEKKKRIKMASADNAKEKCSKDFKI